MTTNGKGRNGWHRATQKTDHAVIVSHAHHVSQYNIKPNRVSRKQKRDWLKGAR